ncbi:MAG: nickel pincer cofactor biosynthesis protein LarC, partial [Planctomycetota bacterium]
MTIAYFDCTSGISGDMTLGALIDAGANVEGIQDAVRSLGIQVTFHVDEVKKCGFRPAHVRIEHPPEHAHRHLHHIEKMIDDASGLTDTIRTSAKKIFHCIGVAEAHVHGTTLQKVHFHEVGAVDSIADIVGTSVALEQLGITQVQASPIPTGSGHVTIAHGRVAIPAPATAEILAGVPLVGSDIPCELTTPTGAAIVKSLATRFGAVPSMTIAKVGYGAGTADLKGQANMLRVLIGDAPTDSAIAQDVVTVLESNLDDQNPESTAAAIGLLMDAGALDAFQTPCMMKKGRCGVVVTVLCEPDKTDQMRDILFRHTTTIGVRLHQMQREKLRRESVTVKTAYGPIKG